MERLPLGEHSYKIAISRDELRLLFEHRAQTGEPLQSFVRRLIRENWDARDPLPGDLQPPIVASPLSVVGPMAVQRELFTADELSAMDSYEMTDVPKRRWCFVFRRDVRP